MKENISGGTIYSLSILGAKGNSWKTRNRTNADFGREGRKIVKRELKGEPQFTLEELHITPFTLRKRYDAGRFRV